MTDIKKLLSEIEAGLKHLPLGAWEIDSERQTDNPYRHLEYALFDADRNRLCGTENSDGGWLEVEYPTGPDDDGRVWNERSRTVIEHIARLCPDNTRAILDYIKALEAEIERLKEAMEPFAKRAERYDPPEEEEDGAPDWDTGGPSLTIGDLRRARAALGGDNG